MLLLLMIHYLVEKRPEAHDSSYFSSVGLYVSLDNEINEKA